MAGSESGWHFAGESNVTENGKINLPDRLFEDEILDPDRVVYWSQEKNVGFVLVSNQPLKNDLYQTHANADIGSAPSYRTNIPKRFFADSLVVRSGSRDRLLTHSGQHQTTESVV